MVSMVGGGVDFDHGVGGGGVGLKSPPSDHPPRTPKNGVPGGPPPPPQILPKKGISQKVEFWGPGGVKKCQKSQKSHFFEKWPFSWVPPCVLIKPPKMPILAKKGGLKKGRRCTHQFGEK